MSFRNKISGLLGAAMRCLGEPVVYSAQGYPSVEIGAVYDGIFEELDPNTGALIVSQKPSIGVKDSDLPAAPLKGDTLTVLGRNFKVIEVMPDGQGGSKLMLHKVI